MSTATRPSPSPSPPPHHPRPPPPRVLPMGAPPHLQRHAPAMVVTDERHSRRLTNIAPGGFSLPLNPSIKGPPLIAASEPIHQEAPLDLVLWLRPTPEHSCSTLAGWLMLAGRRIQDLDRSINR
eukprot:GHVU01197442.1.p1 GENE.GHVU01197442.1~~GHVU01197442.1.p1  ORF type:complete len:124 (-),score=7.31 GHVU01197442.1:88-459(-)